MKPNVRQHPAGVVRSKIPWFISLPRSGSNWIMGMMELYFEKPRGPLIEDHPHRAFRYWYPDGTTKDDLMWEAAHDQQGLDIQSSDSEFGDIFLYRKDVVAYCYSNCKRDKNDKRLNYFLKEYSKTMAKWLPLAKTVIAYEDMVANPEKEFRKIVKHFGQRWSKKKFAKAYAQVTKEDLVSRNPNEDKRDVMYADMLSVEYTAGRKEFRDKHAKYISKYLKDFHKKLVKKGMA